MKAVLNHLEFEFKSVARDKTLLLMNYLFPLAFYFMMAIIMPNINKEFSKTMIPGMIVFTIMVSSLLGMPNPIVSSREKGIYRSYKIYGVNLNSVLFLPVITTAIHITIVSLIIIITSVTVFHSAMPQNLSGFLFAYIDILFAFLGLGTLLGICSPNGRITVLIAQLVFIPSMMLGGIMIPIEMLSKNVGKLSKIFPASHSMNILNNIAVNSKNLSNFYGSAIILALGGLLSFILARYLFTWDSKPSSARRNLIGLAAILPFVISIFIL